MQWPIETSSYVILFFTILLFAFVAWHAITAGIQMSLKCLKKSVSNVESKKTKHSNRLYVLFSVFKMIILQRKIAIK